MERPSRSPLYVGVMLLLGGWGAIFYAWYQAGRQQVDTGQIPYLISGGFGGWALVVMGIGAVLLYAVQVAAWQASAKADELLESLERVEEAAKRRPSGGGGSRSGSSRRRRGGQRRRPRPPSDEAEQDDAPDDD